MKNVNKLIAKQTENDEFKSCSIDDSLPSLQGTFFIVSCLIAGITIAGVLIAGNEIIHQESAGKVISIISIDKGARVETTEGVYFTKELFNLSIDTEMLLVRKNITPPSLCNKSQTQCSRLIGNK
ncbi:hypothetical protein [uncultured Shewanella sp.]|uniref:hypothetical protein n=1 Tax=uncultured Shewanella sp. TaxID=173975 RepID=UPI002632BF23|nr:hypothetical protein [uncultured Shewanella sp.]